MHPISVILPVYNAEKYLPATLDSLLAQTFRDFEIVAVNDESTDGSLRILERYAAKDDRIPRKPAAAFPRRKFPIFSKSPKRCPTN